MYDNKAAAPDDEEMDNSKFLSNFKHLLTILLEEDGEMSQNEGDAEEGDEAKQEYVKKEYFARPYTSDTGVL